MSRPIGAARMGMLPPYLFAAIEQKIADKRRAGVDIISLGIGDPDTPTPPLVIERMRAAVADPGTHQYPSNRGRESFRDAVAGFYSRRFGVDLDPATEIIPALGAKEAIANLNLALLDPGDVALASDPGYPVYTNGPLLVGAEPVAMPLIPGLGFEPDLDAIPADLRDRARIMYLNYPNNPTGAVVEGDLFERVVAFARAHDIIVVHDNAYSEITYDGYVAPSFLATPGAKDVGIEVFSLSKTYNMTGWRSGAVVGNPEVVSAYWQLKTNLDSGMFEAVQEASVAALDSDQASVAEMCEVYRRRRDILVDALTAIGLDVTPPKGAIYVWARVPDGETSASFTERVLEDAAVVITPGAAYGASGEGFVRMSLTTPDDRLLEAASRISRLIDT
ncbi:MAG: aminotransferase class I/II-fold pyridoxal phosphate-dependent enzyme [Thermoleophilia bacterium]|nr:aminotransferase class I/II-fold pyridoxal phosphate-dependent enzyme [Thermoleophilia bacterium]